MADKTLGEQLMDSLTRYTTEKEKEINTAAVKIQREMLTQVIARSPVQDYDHNNGVIAEPFGGGTAISPLS